MFSNLLEKRESVTLTDKKALDIFGVSQDRVNVTTDTAMTHTTVFSCVNVKAQGISSVPFNLYKKTDNGRDKATDHPLFNILNLQVNPFMTSTTWREMIVQDIELRGTHFSQIVRNNAGKIVALYPLQFDNMTVDVDMGKNNNPNITYTYTNLDGYSRSLKSENVLRIVGLPSTNGILGITPITQNSLSIGLGMSAEIFGEKFFSNGANGSGILSTDGEFKTDQAMERIRSQFGEKYKGLANSKKPILLEGGMKWQPITISNNDSQFLETRQFQKSEIASIFRVSPHLINDLSNATFSNITELSQEHVKYCLMPLGVKIESSINTQLLSKKEQKEYYCELNYDGLLRGNFKERSEGYREAINSGWMKPNEVRVKENLSTQDTGDKLLMQSQYTTLEIIEKGEQDEQKNI